VRPERGATEARLIAVIARDEARAAARRLRRRGLGRPAAASALRALATPPRGVGAAAATSTPVSMANIELGLSPPPGGALGGGGGATKGGSGVPRAGAAAIGGGGDAAAAAAAAAAIETTSGLFFDASAPGAPGDVWFVVSRSWLLSWLEVRCSESRRSSSFVVVRRRSSSWRDRTCSLP